MTKSNYHILFFVNQDKIEREEDRYFSKGKTYTGSTVQKAMDKWSKEFPGATFLSIYDVDQMARIK